MSKGKGKDNGKSQVEIPTGARFIMLYEKDNVLRITTGGFQNIDEMIGFNRRVINPNLTEQMIMNAVQKQMEGMKPQIEEAVQASKTETK